MRNTILFIICAVFCLSGCGREGKQQQISFNAAFNEFWLEVNGSSVLFKRTAIDSTKLKDAGKCTISGGKRLKLSEPAIQLVNNHYYVNFESRHF